MTGYAELAKELRTEHEWAKANEWETPIMLSDHLEQAADAIEDLIAALKASNDVIVKSRRDWISVEERLPEEPYGCLLIVWDSDLRGGDDFLNYLPYFAGWDGEQWNDGDGDQVPFEVAYWMPMPSLPEPPKEET